MTKREQDVLEFVQLGGASRVDREKGIIYGAKLLGAKSKNGGRYPRAAREAAKSKYEGIVINVNHPRRDKPGEERKVEERFGVASNVQVTDDGTYADIAYLKSHPMAEPVAEAAERKELSNIFGFSHNAVTVQTDQNGEVVHESITKVRSVDLVADPATTKGVFESMDPAISPDAVPAGSGSGETTTDLIVSKIRAILDGEGEPGEKAKQCSVVIKTLLKLDEQLDGAAASKEKTMPEETTKPATESVKPEDEAAELRRENERLKRREKARDVLESAGLPIESARITALAALESEEDQKALLATWQATPATKSPPAKPKSVPASVLESKEADKPQPGKWDDPKAAAAALLGR